MIAGYAESAGQLQQNAAAGSVVGVARFLVEGGCLCVVGRSERSPRVHGSKEQAALCGFEITGLLGQLKAGERLRSKVLRAGQVIELSTIITAQ